MPSTETAGAAAPRGNPAAAAPDDAAPAELSVGDALALALHLQRHGDLDAAETIYRRILEVAPGHPDALHFLGVLAHQRKRSDEAIELITESLAQVPGQADWHNNLGNILIECGRLAEATEAYRRAIARAPDHADAHSNLGVLLRTQDRFEEAETAYRRAIELDPEHIDARNNLGNLLSGRGRIHEAVDLFCQAIVLDPGHAVSRRMLGIAYSRLGRIDDAAAVFREWLAEEPDNPVARHMYAACSGDRVPTRAEDAYVETVFDSFADTFDAKLEHLGYRAPQLVADVATKIFGAPQKCLDVLDAGCGTGLCGPLLAPFARQLIGVDLSAGMLARALSRSVYDELAKAELTEFLNHHPAAYDFVASADTLVYFGALEAPLEAAFRALRAGGFFAFTVEEIAADAARAPDDDGFRINPHGRYSHRREYVAACLEAAGFTVVSIEAAVLRREGGVAVDGLVIAARRG